jgi:iron complex outermembrane receptor protein
VVPPGHRGPRLHGDGSLSGVRSRLRDGALAALLVLGAGHAAAQDSAAAEAANQDAAPEEAAAPDTAATNAPAKEAPAKGAGETTPPRLTEQVTVTASREKTRLADTPASVAVLTGAALDVTAAPAVDDSLRQVVGFSLFRRTGSRTANPTIQGISLRGVGASGASRAEVLADGLPLDDPFGGWIYWGRVPRLAVDRLEVLRGGASALYGGPALGGAVQIVTRAPGTGPGLVAEASAGEAGFVDGAASAQGERGAWGGRVSIELQNTGGYVPVDPRSRGPVDRSASSRYGSLDALARRRLGDGQAFLRGAFYTETRGNGTTLQENDTQIGLVGGGVDIGPWSARAWASGQELQQSFSAVSEDRTVETLTRGQRVPASALGATAQWARALGGRHRFAGGIEARRVEGTTHETGYFGGAPTSRLEAGGVEHRGAAWIEDVFQAHPRLLLTASARLDAWQHRDGHTVLRPVDGGAPLSDTAHPDRAETAFSPRVGLLYQLPGPFSLAASAYGSFRGPTLNELYRGFRVGSVVTLANPGLRAERLWGGEAGVRFASRTVGVRVTVFDATVHDPVANVTLESTPGLITRQRENLGRLRSRGVEVEAEARLGPRGTLSAGYAFTDARVSSFPADPALEGRWIPQIPRNQAVLQARYETAWRLGLQVRWTGRAYDDDQNTLVLDPALVVDALAARALGGGVELFAAAENLFDARVVAGRTPVPTLGAPRIVRGGVRLRLGPGR